MNSMLTFEFKRSYKIVIISAICSLFLFVMAVSIYPTFSIQLADIEEVFSNIPEVVRKSLGIDVSTWDSIVGFYAYLIEFVKLIAFFTSIVVTIKIFGSEKLSLSTEFIYSKPISKSKIYVNKLLASLAVNLFYWGLLLVGTLVISLFLEDINYAKLLDLYFSVMLMQIFGIGLAALVCSSISNKRVIKSLAPTLTILMFLGSIVSKVLDISAIKYFTVFGLFEGSDVYVNGVNVKYAVIVISIAIVFNIMGIIIVNRKDAV